LNARVLRKMTMLSVIWLRIRVIVEEWRLSHALGMGE
jgi:hypothetical protein